MFDRYELVAVFVGGIVGAIVRAEVAEAIVVAPGSWPWATLIVNLAGAFVLGGVVEVTRRQTASLPAIAWRALIGTGFCGALTTFSTMQLELLRMLDRGDAALAAAYAATSITGGLAMVWLGITFARGRRSAAGSA
jgi:CrcB protein